MGELIGLLGLLVLVVVIGSFLGIAAYSKYTKLNQRVVELERRMAADRRSVERTQKTTAGPEEKPKPQPEQQAEPGIQPLSEAVEAPPLVRAADPLSELSKELPIPDLPQTKEKDRRIGGFFSGITNNWMIWLGGACVGLAGVFLVKYGIDHGFLGPTQRILFAVLGGLGLHGLAEYLRRKTGSGHGSFAALAGGGSITLYAAMLAALHLYQLLSPGTVFIILATISVATMLLALRDGPVMAVIGILGAYIVPVLVSDDSGDILSAMIYALIVSGAALLLIRYVYRDWLLYGVLAGGLGWWLLSLTTGQADGFRGFYLAILTYGLLAIRRFDWLLTGADIEKPEDAGWERLKRLQPDQLGPVLVVLAQTVTIVAEGFSPESFWTWAPLTAILVWAGNCRGLIIFVPWLSLGFQLIAWFYCGLETSQYETLGFHPPLLGQEIDIQKSFLYFSGGMAILYSGLTWLASRRRQFSHVRDSLVFCGPVLWLVLAFFMVTGLEPNWYWAKGSLLLSLFFSIIAGLKIRSGDDPIRSLWPILAAHLAFSLAAAMYFREATLTLVLATQVVSLAYLRKRFQVDHLDWLIKTILAVIVTRLTFNPWLTEYPAGTHWTLWTYGGATLCCGLAGLLTDNASHIKRWLEAVTLHLLVLFLGAETRYRLHSGEIFSVGYGLTEASINTLLWSGLGLAYVYRSKVSEHLKHFYLICSNILFALALVNYAWVLTALNPVWAFQTAATFQPISSTPVWNLLLVAYGAPVAMAILVAWFADGLHRRIAFGVAGIGLLAFVSLEIRHLWQGALRSTLPMTDGELYTYSIVWLVMAVITILYSTLRGWTIYYRAGMALLALVIAKIFLVDMAGLTGLLRVASFMGLGLSLLGVAYLYQRMTRPEKEEGGSPD